ncbi:MAG: trypsin-like peptidase domain-containing protein [Syntrophobacteraceae bacterium]
MVYVYDQTGKAIAQGSGFMLNSRGRLITNYHVLGKAASAKVKTTDGRDLSIKALVAQTPADDLIEALVDITSGSLPYLTSAGVAPKPGDPVTVIGSPYGVSKVVSHGNVTAIQEAPKYRKCIIHSAHSFPGSSGSPLVNDRGEVIGIATAGVPGNPDVNIAVSVERFSGLSPNYRELRAGNSPAASSRGNAVNASDTAGPPSLSPLKDVPPSEPTDPAALVKLALLYEQGRGVPKNCFEALRLYRKADCPGICTGGVSSRANVL